MHAESNSSSHWEPEPLPIAEVDRAMRRSLGRHYATATIADNLGAEADQHVTAGTVLRVVGYDLPNVADPDYCWTARYLPSWLDRGAVVQYFAVKPCLEAIDNLRGLARKAPKKLQAKALRTSFELPERAAKLAEMWRTFHFAVFSGAPQLWVEMNHPEGVKIAHECYYFGPESAEELPLYFSCQSRFDYMFENFGDDLFEA